MRYLTQFLAFWYDFIIGDDWTISAAVVVTLIVVAALTRAHVHAWWVLPIAVLVFLGASVWRAAGTRTQ